MKIYLANTTVQNMEFNYRMPTEVNPKTGRMMWSERLYVERIPAGGQITLGGGRDFSELDVKHIFDHQGANYGVRRNGDLARGFVGTIWDDKPIKVDRIENAVEQNRHAAEERSDTMLNATAAASLVKQSERAQESGSPAPERVELEMAAYRSKDADVGGKGSEATQAGIQPRNRGERRSARL
jgi:hypothetical protein